MRFSNIVVLTGAGLSAESGLGTFRDKGSGGDAGRLRAGSGAGA